MLIEHCSPTLAGLKPGNLFRFEGESNEVHRKVEEWDNKMHSLGVNVMVLKECVRTSASMVYVYRKSWLEEILRDKKILNFLSQFGYQEGSIQDMLKTLSARYCVEGDMPHEIGVFLGYPLEDVVGFIEHKGRNFTCCGCWKSYGDPLDAQRCFDSYKACTSEYRDMYRCGTPIIQLVVAA
jgi:hypothetical protein